MTQEPKWYRIPTLTPEEQAEVRNYMALHGIFDLREIWQRMRSMEHTYYDIIAAIGCGKPIPFEEELFRG